MMFSDFQSFYWIVFGEAVEVALFLLIVVTVISLIVIVFDRAITNLLKKGGDA